MIDSNTRLQAKLNELLNEVTFRFSYSITNICRCCDLCRSSELWWEACMLISHSPYAKSNNWTDLFISFLHNKQEEHDVSVPQGTFQQTVCLHDSADFFSAYKF